MLTGMVRSRIRLLLRTGVLLIGVTAVVGCPERNKILTLPNGCKRVIFHNAVAADIRAEKIDSIPVLMEWPYGTMVDHVLIVLPQTPKMIRLSIFPLEKNKNRVPGCRLLKNDHLLCWREFDDGREGLGLDVVFEKIHPDSVRPRLMSEVERYLRQDVLNCD